MGRWVIEEACRQLRDWHDDGVVRSVAVNLSVRQLDDRGLVDEVAGVLRTTGLDPSALTLEITESAVMEEVDATVRLLNELAALGVRFALDDFGQGYSSLGYLQRFPLHAVKIDKAFVQGIETGRGDRAIVRSVVTLASDLGLAVTAEGVETEQQLAQVTDLGCDNAQGFFFSRPVTAEAARLLCRQSWQVTPAALP
jgi:EAL domain-containing protein (putative c-di-GMP-specific phosphodiesterase class I)